MMKVNQIGRSGNQLFKSQTSEKSENMTAAVELDARPVRNYYSSLVNNLRTAMVSAFTLESGRQLFQVPVAYTSWGTLNEKANNVLLICHALTGSSDVEDWWKSLIGRGKAFDPSRFFIVCFNFLGSPYGSASPLTTDPTTGERYGPNFPDTTFRDDVRIQKLVLDAMGVRQIASVIGGSMGGMIALEWPLSTHPGYVQSIVPISTSAYQSAWGISWNESQIRCIRADAQFHDGNYVPHPNSQPIQGLGAARMIGMLTYRSYASFEARFSRRRCEPKSSLITIPVSQTSSGASLKLEQLKTEMPLGAPIYSAQSYMQYHADKFLKRFDANCYIHLLRKMDSHDITRERVQTDHQPTERHPSVDDLDNILKTCQADALVVSIDTDVLFPTEQQALLATYLPQAKLVKLDSTDGHDGFLLEFANLGHLIKEYLHQKLPELFQSAPSGIEDEDREDGQICSVFGEIDSRFK